MLSEKFSLISACFSLFQLASAYFNLTHFFVPPSVIRSSPLQCLPPRTPVCSSSLKARFEQTGADWSRLDQTRPDLSEMTFQFRRRLNQSANGKVSSLPPVPREYEIIFKGQIH